MQLTTAMVAAYSRGQIEILGDGSIQRGEVRSASLRESTLDVVFMWRARTTASKPPFHWQNVDELEYTIDLGTFRLSDMSGGKISLQSSTGHELITFFPEGSSEALDSDRVHGLDLS